MTLSRWLRDYLYITLGGNRKGRIRTYLNLMITMLLGGLWHGAAWRFVIWGGLHGAALAIHKCYIEWRGERKSAGFSIVLNVFLTFHFICFCWIFFRAPSMDAAGGMLNQIANHFNGQLLPQFVAGYSGVVALMIIGYVLHFVPKSVETAFATRMASLPFPVKAAWIVAIIFIVMQVKSSEIQPFIYFQF